MNSIAETINERESTHGNFYTMACTTQWMKSLLRQGKNWEDMSLDQHEALEMIVHKISRILSGDNNHVDSWHDIAGYATLIELRLEEAKNGRR